MPLIPLMSAQSDGKTHVTNSDIIRILFEESP